MAYKSLLTILSSDRCGERRVAAAVDLARQMDAHLDVLCLGIDAVQVGYYFAGADAVVQQTSIEQARLNAEATVDHAKKLLEGTDIRHSVHGMVAQFGALGDLVARYARYADLVILPKPYGSDDIPAENESLLEAALFSGQAPVLVIPNEGLPKDFGKVIVVGWNEGAEALDAVRAAMPILTQADTVSVAIVDPAARGRDETEPGHDLSVMLDRHGVNVDVAVLARTTPRISDILMNHCRDVGATVLVAGAYGHSRFRQAILGGATRDLLTNTTVPVLMAH